MIGDESGELVGVVGGEALTGDVVDTEHHRHAEMAPGRRGAAREPRCAPKRLHLRMGGVERSLDGAHHVLVSAFV